MFGLSASESLVLIAVLILVIKPKDMPKVFQTLGRLYGKAIRIYHVFLDEFNKLSEVTDSNQKK